MATFWISFIGSGMDDEEVTAELYVDSPPFIDFRAFDQKANTDVTVARYRADAIKRIIREPSAP